MISFFASLTQAFRRRRARRVAVVATLAVTAFLAASYPRSLHGFGIVIVLVLVVLDVLLVRATGGLALRRKGPLDEREAALRNLSYRLAFRLLGLALVIGVVVAIVTAVIAHSVDNPANGVVPAYDSGSAIDGGVPGRLLVAIVELLVMMPTLVMAWVDGDAIEPDTIGGTRPRWAGLLALPAAAGAWLLLFTAIPDQAVAQSHTTTEVTLHGATCHQFAGGRTVGAEFGAVVGMHVAVCWNGAAAFVYGDPSYPLPASAVAALQAGPAQGDLPLNEIDPAQPQLTACGLDNIDDFARVSDTTCSARIDTGGTLHYAVSARVAALPFGGGRDVSFNLVVDRNGNVLQSP